MRILQNGLGSMASLDQALIHINWPSTNMAPTTKTQNIITPKHQSGDLPMIGSNTQELLQWRRPVHIMTRPVRFKKGPKSIPPTIVSRLQGSALEAAHSWSTLDFALLARDLIDHPVISAMSTSGNSRSSPWTSPVATDGTKAKENSTRPPTRWPSQERWGHRETRPLSINVTAVHNYLLRIPSSIPCRYRPRDPRCLPAKVRKTPGKLLPHSTRRRRWPSPRKIVPTTCIIKTYRPWSKCQKHRR